MKFFKKDANLKKARTQYIGYPEQPYISTHRDFKSWFEMITLFPDKIVPVRNMQRNADGLLPGHVILLYWLSSIKRKKKNPSEYPVYFEFEYGIDPNKEQQFLVSKGYITLKDELTDTGQFILKKYRKIIDDHKDPDGLKRARQKQLKNNHGMFVPTAGDDGLDAEHQGFELYKLGDYAEAEKALLYAVDLEFPAPALYEKLAILYRKQKRYEDEVNIIQKGISIIKRAGVNGNTQGLNKRLEKAKLLKNTK